MTIATRAPSVTTKTIDNTSRVGSRASSSHGVRYDVRCAGNQAVQRLRRTPLFVGPANDPAEREADDVAAAVTGTAAVQRLCCSTCADEAQLKAPPVVQRVLAGQGTPIPHPVRRERESSFGRNYGSANVISRQETKAEAPTATDAVGSVAVYGGKTMTAEAVLREIYAKAAREVTHEARRMIANGASVEHAARWATVARNELKVGIRLRGSPVARALAEARNMRRYGNKVGPTYDELIRQGKTPEEIIGKAGRASTKITKVATRLHVAGRLLILLDVAIVGWEVYEAEEGSGLRTAVAGAGGIGGALAGGWAGAKAGAAVGVWFEGVGAVPGALIGGIAGAVAGGFAGRGAAGAAYDFAEELTTPNIEREMEAIDAAEDVSIRSAG